MEAAEPGALGGYVCEVVGCPAERVTAVSRFPHGNGHAVYKVSYLAADGTQADVVVRISFGGAAEDRARAQREARVLAHVHGTGAPRLYDFWAASTFGTPVMCMEFLAGDQHDVGSATAGEIEQLGALVGVLHRRPVGDLAGPLAAPVDLSAYAEDRLRAILAGVAWARDPLPRRVREQLDRAAASIRTRWETTREATCFRTGESLRLLHGDIGPGNVVWGPGPALIDWEYTRLGDPADELAYTFDQNGLTPAQRQAFWSAYQLDADDRIAERLEWWERLTLLGSSLWWAERCVRRAEADALGSPDPAVPRDRGYYYDHLITRLERLTAAVAA